MFAVNFRRGTRSVRPADGREDIVCEKDKMAYILVMGRTELTKQLKISKY